jgi:hypothetical protein
MTHNLISAVHTAQGNITVPVDSVLCYGTFQRNLGKMNYSFPINFRFSRDHSQELVSITGRQNKFETGPYILGTGYKDFPANYKKTKLNSHKRSAKNSRIQSPKTNWRWGTTFAVIRDWTARLGRELLPPPEAKRCARIKQINTTCNIPSNSHA